MRRCATWPAITVVAFVCVLLAPQRAGAIDGWPTGVELTNTGSGTRGWVRIADDDGLEPQVFTIEAWIRPLGGGYGGSGDQWGAVVVGKPREGASGTYQSSFFLNWAVAGERVVAGVAHNMGSSGTRFRSTGTVPVGTKAHVAVTFDGVWLRIFIDGQLDSEMPAAGSNVDYGDQDVLIGAGNFASGWIRAYQGVVDDVRIWNYARDAGQISAEMACSLDGTEPGLLAYYSFNAGDLRDDSGNGHDGVEDGLVDYVLSNDACLPFLADFERGDLSGWSGVFGQ